MSTPTDDTYDGTRVYRVVDDEGDDGGEVFMFRSDARHSLFEAESDGIKARIQVADLTWRNER